MRLPLRMLSDDLTGALDSAAMLAGRGPVPVHLAPPETDDAAPVSVLATGTRDAPEQALTVAMTAALPWFRSAGLPFKRIDSLLRGNSLAELAWVARQGYERVLLAPAFPAHGRFTVAGRPLLGPPYRPDEAAVLAYRPDLVAALAQLGMAAVAGPSVAQPPSAHPLVLIPDVRSDADLATHVERALADPEGLLWCGSAGLASALAGPLGLAPAAPGRLPAGPPGRDRWLVTASRHPVTRAQMRYLRERPAAFAPAETVSDLADDTPLPPQVAAARLARAARALAGRGRPSLLVVVGGDTLLALCRAAGVARLDALPAPRIGWGHARLVGGAWDGVTCLSRSGAMGRPDELASLLDALAAA